MRSDKSKNANDALREGNGGRTGFQKFTKIVALLFFALTLVTGGMLVLADILARKYLAIAGVVFIGFVIVVFFCLYRKKTGPVARWLGLILALGLGFVYLVGIRYLSGTMDFVSRITQIASADEYYVVVRDDDMFMELGDIQGENVHVLQTSSSYEDAMAELQNKVSVVFTQESEINSMIEDLLFGSYNVALVSSGTYEAYSEANESFDDYTKILDRFKVRRQVIDISRPVAVTSEPFNIYITGLDTEGTIETSARSDVNMIATVHPDTKTILLTSIPRDYYVLLPDVGAYDKLTHTGYNGANYTIETVENMLNSGTDGGIDINYYVKVNFTTVRTLIDAIDGIDIVSEKTFTTSDGMYYFEEGVSKHVDGTEALRFARERYAFVDGDFQRNRDQQIVLKAVINKVSQSTTLLFNYTGILNAIEDNIEMNMSADELKALIRMQTGDMAGWNIISQNIIGTTSSEFSYTLGQYASVVLQDQASINSAVERINAVMAGATE